MGIMSRRGRREGQSAYVLGGAPEQSIQRVGNQVAGSPDTRLVVLRGNSGAGKSTVARTLRQRVGAGLAWVEQDYIRRRLLAEHDRPGMANIGLIDLTVRYALDAGYYVILDGILPAAHYRAMLTDLHRDHQGLTWHAYFDVPLAETQRRHLDRSWASEVGIERLAEWYLPGDLLPDIDQAVIDADTTADEAADLIIDRALLTCPPIRVIRPETDFL